MKLIKMKFILALIFICNITSLQGQLDEAFPFYNTFNDQILKAKLSFADSKKDVENIYSLKSDEKSRVLILDYVEAHDQLLTICDAATKLLSIYVIVPKSEINNELITKDNNKIWHIDVLLQLYYWGVIFLLYLVYYILLPWNT